VPAVAGRPVDHEVCPEILRRLVGRGVEGDDGLPVGRQQTLSEAEVDGVRQGETCPIRDAAADERAGNER
jgi:hypothetical protein